MDNLKRVEVLTPPAIEPVSLDDCKSYMKITNDGSDELIEALIPVARKKIEDYLNVTMIETEFRQWADHPPGNRSDPWWDGVREGHIGDVFSPGSQFELRRRPLIEFEVFNYFSEDDTENVLSTDNYRVSGIGQYFPARVVLKLGGLWPENGNLRRSDGLAVSFKAGFPPVGDDPYPSPSTDEETAAHEAWLRSGVPPELKQAVIITVAAMHDNTGSCAGGSFGTGSGLPVLADTMISSWILPRVA